MTVPNTTYRVLVEKLGDSDPAGFVGNEGELFYDPSVPSIKLSDGNTPGGLEISGGDSSWTTTGNGIYYSSGNVAIGGPVSAGSTTLVVHGDARITGILSVGTATITLDPNENAIKIGTGVTISAVNNSIQALGSEGSINLDPNSFVLTYGSIGIGSTTSAIGVGRTTDTTEQYFSGLAFDSNGNILATGADYDEGIPYIIKFDASGNILWQKFFTNVDNQRRYTVSEAVAVDKSSNDVYVGVHPDDNISSIIIAKLDSSGSIIWQTELGANDSAYVEAISVGPNRDVYVCGGNFVFKLDIDGNILWQKTIAGGGANGLVVDSNDNVIFTKGENYDYTGSTSLLLIKIDSDGNNVWQKFVYDYDWGYGNGVAVDSNDNIYLAGEKYFQDHDSTDAILVKFDIDGNYIWQKRIYHPEFNEWEWASSVEVDSNDNVYITGTYYNDNYNVTCLYVVSFDSSGNVLWKKDALPYPYGDIYHWYYDGHDMIDIRNDQLILGGYIYNEQNLDYADGVIIKIPIDGLNCDGIYGRTCKIQDSELQIEVSSLDIGSGTVTVDDSSFDVQTGTLISNDNCVDIGFTGIASDVAQIPGTSSFVAIPNTGQRITTTSEDGTVTTIEPLLTGPFTTVSTTPDFASNWNGYWQLTLPFSVDFSGISTNTIYIGTQSIITFGGIEPYIDSNRVDFDHPAFPKIMISADDNYGLKISYEESGISPTRTFKVRYEGIADWNNQYDNNPNIIWEATFYEDTPNWIDIQIGQNVRYTKYDIKSNNFHYDDQTTYSLETKNLNINSIYTVDAKSVVDIATTEPATIDLFNYERYRSARLQVQISQNGSHQASDLLVIHDGDTVNIIEYGTVATGDYLATFSGIIDSGYINVQVNMASSNTANVHVVSQKMAV